MRKKMLILVLALALTVFQSACGRNQVRMGTAAVGGIYDVFGSELAGYAQESGAGFTIVPKNTAGSAANLRLLTQGYLDLAIAQTDIIHKSYFGEESQTVGHTPDYQAIAALYTEDCQILVAADAEIFRIEDLAYRIVSIGEKESGTAENAIEILHAYGLDESLVKERNMSYLDAVEALKNREIDAMFCTVGTPAQALTDLARDFPIRLLSIDEEHREKILFSYGFYVPRTIPAGSYPGQTEPVETVGVRAALLASGTLSEETVEAITRLLFANRERLEEAMDIKLELDPADPLAGVTIPLHPGAKKYYEGM